MQLDIDIRKTMHSGSRKFRLDVRLRSSSRRVVIVGPSGAGKTLTLQAIAGLLRPDAGHIRLDGRLLFDSTGGIDRPPQAREVAYVFQDYALFPHLTVRQNVAFVLTRGWARPPHHRGCDAGGLLVAQLRTRSAGGPVSIRAVRGTTPAHGTGAGTGQEAACPAAG